MADCFLDTNVLLYAVSTNPAEADKTRTARTLVQSTDWAWSAQVAAEFIRASTSPRQPKPLARAEARRWVETWLALAGAKFAATMQPLRTRRVIVFSAACPDRKESFQES